MWTKSVVYWRKTDKETIEIFKKDWLQPIGTISMPSSGFAFEIQPSYLSYNKVN
jgi:hypothetical protein